MPLLIAQIENEEPVVTKEEKLKLLTVVIEDEVDSSKLIDDSRMDDFSDILDNIKKQKEEEEKRKQDGTSSNTVPKESVSVPSKSSGISKKKVKNKSSKSPESAPISVDNSGAQTSDVVKNTKINPPIITTDIRVTSYIEQGKINDSSYWAYRSVEGPSGIYGKKENEKNLSIQSIKGYVKYKFDADWNKLTQGISIDSVWDVLIAMNIPQVGIFNDKVPYIAEENTEQHMMILNDKHVYNRGKDTAIGLYQQNPSWADEPYWCGVWTEFLIGRSGLKTYSGTTDVDRYHRILVSNGLVNSPPNIIDNEGKIKFQNSWLPEKPEKYYSDGKCAIFVKGYHFDKNGNLLPNGKNLLKYLLGLDWAMATVSVGPTKTHIETCVYLSDSGNMITIGGNTGLRGVDRNGTQFSVKKNTISTFCGENDYIVFGKITGNPNRSAQRLNAKHNNTKTMNEYFSAVNNNKKNINKSLSQIIKTLN
jgi:hypothetical protein